MPRERAVTANGSSSARSRPLAEHLAEHPGDLQPEREPRQHEGDEPPVTGDGEPAEREGEETASSRMPMRNGGTETTTSSDSPARPPSQGRRPAVLRASSRARTTPKSAAVSASWIVGGIWEDRISPTPRCRR
ncbi:hypothetical protein [Streptosporangium vulgare]|uniref:hypothetical protein n=1 Tax=Streptosporangium vulgare TaxID=46190 RepID=UPI0031DE80E8